MHDLSGILEKAARLLFPPKCIFCGEILPLTTMTEICSQCHGKIPFTETLFLPPGAESSSAKGCDAVMCLCRYTGMFRDSVIHYKFNDKPSYYRALAYLMCEKARKMTNYYNFDIIMSVPLHKNRELARGYNQSRLLSRFMAKELGKPDLSGILVRIRNTGVQSRLAKDDRATNVKGAFVVRDPSKICGKSIMLVDDIVTTGNTIGECSRVLKEAGAAVVVGAALASGRQD